MNDQKTRSLMLHDNDKVHEQLLSDSTQQLGEIHQVLLKSEEIMDGKRWTVKSGSMASILSGVTEFGKEVGGDEIHWWIFQKETDLVQLAARSKTALDAVQVLKDAASRLKEHEPDSYEHLLTTLKEFADLHRENINVLHDYVNWLSQRDVLAPNILFTYRVWGSTRRADRMLRFEADDIRSDKRSLLTLAEIVLGIRTRDNLVYNRAHMEIGMSIFDSMDPEQISDDAEFIVPESRVLRRTSCAVYDNCATYFTEIRDSLRNVLLDIDKFHEQKSLFESDEFWRQFLTKARSVKTTEQQLWDFKKTLTLWHVKGETEKRDAKVTFSEDIASFANTSGGVLVVGIDDDKTIVGVGAGRELESRLKVARDVVAQHLEYDRELVSFRQLAIRDNGQDKICLIIVISQAGRPVGVTDGHGYYSYPVRRETGISRVSRNAIRTRLTSDNRDFIHELRQFVRDN